MAVVYVLMYFKCKICFTVYTGETKINDTYLLVKLRILSRRHPLIPLSTDKAIDFASLDRNHCWLCDSLIYQAWAMRCSVSLISYNNGAKYRDQKLLRRTIMSRFLSLIIFNKPERARLMKRMSKRKYAYMVYIN